MDINLEELKKICLDFFRLAGTGFSLWDENRNNIFSYPESHGPFCKVIRENRKMYLKCLKSDNKGLDEVDRTKKPYIYTCHMGLTEAIVPILQDSDIVGYLMVGQIAKKEDGESIRQLIERLDEDKSLKDELLSKLNENTTYSGDKITYCVNTLKVLIDYMNLSYVFRRSNETVISKTKKYITDNISSPILPKDICKYVGVSSNTLYKTCIKETGHSPTHLIRKMKIEKARKNLVKTQASISVIAEQVGFTDVNYFIRVFKKEAGVSPLKYRKINQTE